MNESTASIARNTKAMMVSQVITWSSSFVLMSFLPRHLGAEEYGRLYFAISVNAIAGMLSDLGFTMLLVKEVARDKSKVSSLFVNAMSMRIIAWSVSLVCVMTFVVLWGYPSDTVRMVLILGVANLFMGAYDLIHRIFVGFERIQFRSIALVVEKVFLALIAVVLLILGYGALTIAVVMLVSMALNLFVSIYFLRGMASIDLSDIAPRTWGPLFREGMPFMISFVFGFIYYRIDVMMLSSMTNDTVVGWYGAPYKLFDTLMFFPVILNTAVYPVLSRLFQTSNEGITQTSRKIFDLTIIVAVPTAVGMIALAEPIVLLLFTAKFTNSIILLQILSVSLLLVYLDFVLNTVLVSYDKQRTLPWVALVATVINVTLNYFAIIYFHKHYGNGAIGAAITTAITEICVMAMYVYLLPKGCFGVENLVLAMKTLASGVAMWFTIWLSISYMHNWILAAIVGSVVYFALLFSLKVVSRRDIRFLIGMLPFRKQAVA